MAEFLHDLNIHGAGQIQFKTTAGANAGKIDQNGNDLVLSNPVGDIIIGNGSDDVFIGDGTNAVDIRFEQNMAIFADSSSTKTLTLGGSNTSLILESPTFNGTVTLGATTINNKLTFTTGTGYIVFDYEPSTGSNAEYSSEVPLLKVDHAGTEKTILSRLTNNAALAIGNDDTVAIVAGDTKAVIKDNWNYPNENVLFAAEGGFYAFGFPDNNVTWANRNVFQFRSESATASNNGLYIGDGGQTQFIDLDRNLKNIGTISSTGDVTITNGNIIFSSQYGIRFTDANTRIYTNTDSPEDLLVEADQDLLLTPDRYVGVNTTTPASVLHINTGSGTQNSNTVIIDRAGSSDYSGVSFATAGTVDWSIGQNSAGTFEVYEDGQDAQTRLTIASGGNATFAGDIAVGPKSNATVQVSESGNSTVKMLAGSVGRVGTYSNHNLNLMVNSNTALTLDTSQDALFASDVAVTAKLAVGATSVHASYDLYNQGTFYSNGAATINADLTVDAGSISISGDGSNAVTLTESGSGDFTIDAADDIRLDAGGGDIVLRDDGSEYARLTNESQTLVIKASTNDMDIKFNGFDNGTGITALKLDMSNAGEGQFNNSIRVPGEITKAGSTTFSIDLKDHSNYTWLRNEPGQWSFQSGTSGDDWTQSWQIYVPNVDSDGGNATFVELGQRHTNDTTGEFKGVKIVKRTGSGVVDGDFQAGATTVSDLTVTGNLTITGDINSYNVTDLDVSDKTITIGKGQTEANSGGSGIIVDGSSASILWDESNDTWDLNKGLDVAGNIHAQSNLSASGTLTINGHSTLGNATSDTTTINGSTILNKKAASGNTNIAIAQLKTADGSTTWNIGGSNTSYNDFMIWAPDKGVGNYFQINKSSGQVKIGADTSGSDLIVYGNATGERMFWDASESNLTINHDTDDAGLEIYTVASAQPTTHQVKIGRDNGQYLGIRVDDGRSYFVHRQDESGGSDNHHQSNQIWTDGGGTHTWNWDIANSSGSSPSNKMQLNSSGNLTVAGNIILGDGQYIHLGDNPDLKIYHNGSHSFIQDTGAGDLRFLGSTIRLQSTTEENMLVATPDAGVTLYYNNSAKFETYNAGVGVTGSAYLTSGNHIHFDNGVSNNYYVRKTGTTLEFKTGGSYNFLSGNADFAGTLQWGNGKAILTYGSDRGIIRADQVLELQTNATSSPTAALTLDTSQNATFAGGISYAGTLTSTGSTTIPIYARSTSNVSYIQIQNSATGSNSGNDGLTVGVNGTAAYVWNREQANLYLGTNDTTAVTIDSSQNATFAGNVYIDGDDIYLGDEETRIKTYSTYLGIFAAGGSAKDVKAKSLTLTNDFNNSAPTNGLYVQGDANFGADVTIGTTSSTKALKLPNNSEIQLFNTNDDNKFTIRNIGSAQNTFAIETNDGTDALTISSLGNATFAGDILVNTATSGRYIQIDHSDDSLKLADNNKIKIGTSNDLQIYHEGTDSIIQNYTGSIYVDNNADNQDIVFRCDDGSGGLATYFRVDGSEVETGFLKTTHHYDNIQARFGDSGDLRIYHDGSNSYISDTGTGDLFIKASNDIYLQGANNEFMAEFSENGSVDLYYNGSKKFETTASGISVTNGITLGGTVAARTIPYVIHTGWGDDTSTTANKIIPLGNSVTEQNVSAADGQHFFIAPYNGKVQKIIMKNVAGTLSSSFTTELKLYINGANVTSSGELTASSSAITWEPSSSNTFSAADEISLVYQKSATSKYWREVSLTMVLTMNGQDI